MALTNNNQIVAEICIDSAEGVVASKNAGAQRVELCSALIEGGLTPSYGMTKLASSVSGPVGIQVMIRPRGGDFLYTDSEFAVMKADISAIKKLDISGFVFGLLDPEGNIDIPRTAELVAMCRPASVTFHRAFDMARDPIESLDRIIDLGVDRLLTSGQAPSVLEGAPLIQKLIAHANGRLVVMPGGDITETNVARIIQNTGAKEIHFAALETQSGPMQYRNNRVFMGGSLRPPEYDRMVTSPTGIINVLKATKDISSDD